MAIWREPALEEVIGGPLDSSGLTEASLHGLIAQSAREGEQLDFKTKPHLPSTTTTPPTTPPAPTPTGSNKPPIKWSAEQELAKDVCAFANHQGGLLLIGVSEQGNIATAIAPPVTDPAHLEQRMRTALSNFATPTPRIGFIPIESSTGDYYLAIIVPPSRMAPHAVRGALSDQRRSLHYPMRDGTETRWMLEPEIADRYRLRTLAAENRQTLTATTVSDGMEALDRAQGLWLYVALVPEAPGSSTFDHTRVREIGDWWSAYAFSSPNSRLLINGAVLTPAPGRVTITRSGIGKPGEEESDPRAGYAELYADGRAFAATAIGEHTTRENGPGVVGDVTLADDLLLALNIALTWAVDQASAWGTAEASVGLVVHGKLDQPFDVPLTLHKNSNGDLRRLPNTRVVRRPPQAQVPVDLATCVDQQGRLMALYHVLSALMQHFGVAQPRQVEPDGTVEAP